MSFENRKGTKERGATLIELLVSMSVFLIGMAAVFGVMRISTVQKNTVSSRTDQIRSARIALEYIRRDALNAGFGYHRTGGNVPDNSVRPLLGIPNDTDAERDLLTSVIAGNQTNANNLVFNGRTDVLGIISRDPTFNGGQLINYTGSAAAGSAVQVTTGANACTACNVHDVFLFESASGTTQVIGTVTAKPNNSTIQLATGTADPLGFNQAPTGDINTQSLLVTTAGGGTIKRVNFVSYSVTPEGVLVRRRFGNQTGRPANEQIEIRELVYGVSDFQVQYYMEDGTTVDDPALANSGRLNQMKLNNVVQIQVTVTLVTDANDSQPKVTTPVTIKEFISTKNLRYEAS